MTGKPKPPKRGKGPIPAKTRALLRQRSSGRREASKIRHSNTSSGRMRAALNRWWNTCQGLTLNQESVDWRAPMESTHCTAPGCERPDTRNAGEDRACSMHYKRWRLRGTFDLATPATRKKRTSAVVRVACSVSDCGTLRDGRSLYCKMHDMRFRRHGDPLAYVPHSDRKWKTGAASYQWTGDEATYFAVHQRLRKARGPASDYECQCGAPALQWSYDHLDPKERSEAIDNSLVAYSTRLDHYRPMCVRCHKRYDLDLLAGEG